MAVEQRRLAAILAADVVGYSRLMGADETRTQRRVKGLMDDLVKPRVSALRGRVVKTMGDGVLAEFSSVLNAFGAAVSIQRSLAAHELEASDLDKIQMRIGINLGDIIVDGSDVFGDGVILAARIEGVCPPGEICVSSRAYEDLRRLRVSFNPLGVVKLKNIDRDVEIYSFDPNSAISEELADIIRSAANDPNRMLSMQVNELEWSIRTGNCLKNANIIYVGDLVQNTEYELLRLPNFGRKSLNETKEVLEGMGLHLGMLLHNWPPEHIVKDKEFETIARKVASISQQKLGANFAQLDDVLTIHQDVDLEDEHASRDRITEQLHIESLRKLKSFGDSARKLDNQSGWSGIDNLNRRFVDLLDRSTSDIPDVIGLIYGAAIELGSFLELDNRIRRGEASYAVGLEPDVRRPLEDAVRTIAPWLRRFPTARELDDETGQFLSQVSQIDTAERAIGAARSAEVIRPNDAAVLQGLIDAARRGSGVGAKAASRGVLSARNLAVAAASIPATEFLRERTTAENSTIVRRADRFLVDAEGAILELVQDLPDDLRLALESLIKRAAESD